MLQAIPAHLYSEASSYWGYRHCWQSLISAPYRAANAIRFDKL